MSNHTICLRVLCVLLPLFLSACGGYKEFSNVAVISGEAGPSAQYKGSTVSTMAGEVASGLALPDGSGGVVLLPGSSHREQNSGYVEARELKLKIRELAEQLVADMQDCSLQNSVAVPVAFVDLNDFSQSSPLGRLIAEQLFHELNQRGYPVREYRIPGAIRSKKQQESFSLSGSLANLAARPGSVVILGTYQQDREAVFVNARLINPKSGRVLRTANLVLANNDMTRRMLRGGGKQLTGGSMNIRDFSETTRPAPTGRMSPFDRGEDIH